MVENTSTPSRAWNSKHVAMDLPDLKEHTFPSIFRETLQWKREGKKDQIHRANQRTAGGGMF